MTSRDGSAVHVSVLQHGDHFGSVTLSSLLVLSNSLTVLTSDPCSPSPPYLHEKVHGRADLVQTPCPSPLENTQHPTAKDNKQHRRQKQKTNNTQQKKPNNNPKPCYVQLCQIIVNRDAIA